jgi:WD40 repeat protein/tRNA A-37 threonylcarbamoyl transferase component Bud32
MSQASSPPESARDAEPLLFHFDQAWRSGTPPRIEDYLPRLKNQGEARKFLEDLVKIDLEYRWRQKPTGAGSLPSCCRLEDYVKHYPQLGPLEGLSPELVGEEYLIRRRWGDQPRHADYVRRFPRHGAGLLTELARLDAELSAELAGKGPLLPGSRPQPEAPVQPVISLTAMVASLTGGGLLSAAQQQELTGSLSGRFSEPRALGRELLQRRWLTAYQLNQLLLGRTADLTVGPYLLLERLGEGGAGQVFKARHRRLDKLVALKLIRKNLLTDPEVVGRFQREIHILSQLDHPNIVHAYDSGSSGASHYLAMEFVEGTDLGRLVKKGGRMPVEQACAYILQAARGLAHAHERGLVHRDIKPHNLIMSVRDGLVKVADLGLARLPRTMGQEATVLRDVQTTGTLTPENAVLMGTADYLAPEQALDFHAADIRADIYSLGCTFYYLLTGQPPFPGGNLAQKVAKHLQGDMPAVEGLRSDLPAGLAALLRKMLARKPEDRYQTPADVVGALAPFAGASAERAGQRIKWLGHASRLFGNRRAALVAGGAGVMGLLLGLGWLWRGRDKPSWPRKVDEFPLKRQDYLHTIVFSHDGKLAATSGGDTVIALWDTTVGKQGDRKLFTLSGHKGAVSHLAISADNRWLASGSGEEKKWRLWDLRSQREVDARPVDTRSQYHASRPFVGPFSPDGKLLAICHGEGTVSLVDVATRENATQFVHKELPVALAFSQDSRSFAVVAANKLVVYDIATGKEMVSALPGSYIWALAFSPDGTLLAAARAHNEIQVLDAATLKPRWADKIPTPQRLPSRTPILGMGFAGDGKTLALGGFDHQVKLWEPAIGREIVTIAATEAYNKPVCALAISADGNTVRVGAEDDIVRIWRVRE